MSGCACLPFNKKAPKEASSAAAVKVDSLKKPTTKQTTPPSKVRPPPPLFLLPRYSPYSNPRPSVLGRFLPIISMLAACCRFRFFSFVVPKQITHL
jgi:hypothetical protein